MLLRVVPFVIVCIALLGAPGCQRRPAASVSATETRQSCEERRTAFASYVASLSDRPVVSPTRVELTASTLGRVPGAGAVVELSPDQMVVDGTAATERDLGARVAKFARWVASTYSSGDDRTGFRGAARAAPGRVLYVAAAPDLDVQTLRAFLVEVPDFVELRLLVRTPAVKGAPDLEAATAAARDLSSRILLEADPGERKRLADRGYATFSDCEAFTSATSGIRDVDPRTRWPTLRAALVNAVPACDCKTLDTASLQLVVGAEQRAGAASLGWVPLSFLRDERCDATMPLRAVKKLVHQLEEFDEEFSAGVDRDALRFGDVLENDRLRVYFCDALPGETLAAKARGHATLFFRAPGADACEGWSFEPLALGTPMGTLRRIGSRSLAFHYWHAAEEIRVFGPVDPAAPSKPTDSRKWPCDETLRLTGVDASSIETDAGRFFYDEAACSRTHDELHGAGCFAARAAGTAEPEPRPDTRTESLRAK